MNGSSLFSRAFVLTLLAAGSMLAVASEVAAQGQGPTMVGVDEVRSEPLHQTAPVLGRLVTLREGAVAAEVEGLVAAVEANVGDRVAKGDPLVVLEQRRLALERDLASAEFETMIGEFAAARAELALLRGERDRLARLEGSAAFSGAQLEDKEREIAVAQQRIQGTRAQIDQTRVHLERAVEDLADSTIRAPYEGTVSARHVSPGAYVQVGDPVMGLIDDSALEIEADVPGERTGALAPGTEVSFELQNGGSGSARVRAIVPSENPMTRTRAVRFTSTFESVGEPLAVGQSATLELPIGAPREVVTVHKDAIVQKQGGPMVFLVEEGAAQVRPVQLGDAVGGRFEVLEGLSPGDLVVIRGNERLQPGQPVTYPGAPTAAAPAPAAEG